VQTIAAAHRKGLPTPAGAILLSPWVNLNDETTSDSWERNKDFDYLPADLAYMFANMYRGNYTWEEVSATYLPDAELAALPPLLIEVGECEVLHDQIIKFAAKCIAQDVDVEVHDRVDMVHVFPMFSAAGMAQCDDAYTAMAAFCRRVMPEVYADNPSLPPPPPPASARGAAAPKTAAELASSMFHSFFS
jgi:acetyl esterase/lipase